MTKKILISAIAVFLAFAVVFSTVAVCLFAIGIKGAVKHNGIRGEKAPTPAEPSLSGTGYLGPFAVEDKSGNTYPSSGGVTAEVSEGVLTGYTTPGGNKFELTTTVGSGIHDSIALNGVTLATVFYEAGDMYGDVITFGNNIVTPVTDGSRTKALLINDGTMSFGYTASGALGSIYFLEKEVRTYSITEGNVITATKGMAGAQVDYKYENDALIADSDAEISCGAGSVKVTSGGELCEYRFEYSYLGKAYLSSIYRNGRLYASYSYICDTVASVSYADGSTVDYVLDSDLNCLGMVKNGKAYAFIYAADGNLFAVLDSDGAMVASYDVLPYSVSVYDPFLLGNTVVSRGTVVDEATGAVIRNGEVMLGGAVASQSGATRRAKASDALVFTGARSVYSERSALDINTAIRAKVIDEALFTLEKDGYATVSSVSITNGNGDELGIADIYVLPGEAAGQSIKNALSGNKVFSVVPVSADREAARAALAECALAESDLFVDYYDLYKPELGDITFEGQFIYLGYLIGYSAYNGVISYGIYENDSACYKYYNNIYDYDKGVYAMYGTDTFSADNWDYTAIIPGVNRETYDVVEAYIEEALEICSYTTFENVEYYDSGYYDSYVNSAYGDTLDLYVSLDPSAMITLSESGDITVKAVPFFEQTAVRKEFYRAVGTAVVATAVAGFISIAVPGLGTVCIAIMKTAIITGLTNMVTTTVSTMLIDYAKEEFLGIELNETFNERVHRYVITALNAYSLGVVTGAVAGGIRYAKFEKTSGLNLSSRTSASERMQYRLDMLDKDYPASLIDDSMSARQEYEKYKMIIESTDYSLGSISKNVVYCTGKDVRNVKRVMNVFGKAEELVMINTGGGN